MNTQGDELIYYCRNCQNKYLCEEVLGSERGGSEYLCPSCNATVTEMTVERAQQLGLAFNLRLTPKQSTRPVDQIRRTWFYSRGEMILPKDFVTDLISYNGLEPPQLFDLMFHSDLQYRPTDKIIDKKSLLWDIFSKKASIIRSLHNSLITRSEHRKVDLIIRALTDYRTFGCSHLSSIIPAPLAGTVDLIGTDEITGGIVWILVQEDKIDENVINSILNELLSLPPLEFMGVTRILLLTRKWIWMAAEIARRQGRITTRWKRLNIELWEEDALFNHQKI
ncbi:MAG: hypothetical protein JSV04_01935 [Candidatus Heimdallarchaeota archaeon]|nr:MAG: hypothetical protein JSV04_01935 [Candidatus Heimdallarchaeota archaeon]